MKIILVGTMLLITAGCARSPGPPSAVGTSPPPTQTLAPRLACDDVSTFVVTSQPDELRSGATPEAAADAVVASNDRYDQALRIGIDPAGERFALLRDGAIVEELVVGESDGMWVEVSYDSCT